MEKIDNLCPYCMTKSLTDGECKFCYHEGEPVTNEVYQLPVMYALDDRYVIGRVLGEGNFGITYLAFDAKHGVRTAIKEYYPTGFATRDGADVKPYSGDKSAYFKRGIEKFKSEANALAQFADKPGIVKIRETIETNGTVYIVMEFVEGKTLEERLTLDNTLSEKDLLAIMKPMIASLAEIHKTGIMHRDIAPDNIIIEPSETAKLIDFGSAVVADGSGNSTMSIVKHGFAAEEQYDMNRERQGPWTDVYSLCAVMYRVLTGKLPPDALDRLRGDKIEELPDDISESTRNALKFGLTVFADKRTQSAEELYAELYEGKISPLLDPKAKKAAEDKKAAKKAEKDVLATPIQKPGEEPPKADKAEKQKGKFNTAAFVFGLIAIFELLLIMGMVWLPQS
jgi:serine/threonine protein kinase